MTGFVIPMDPESNWDICPVCRVHLSKLTEFPGIEQMRQYHTDHKAADRGTPSRTTDPTT